MAPRRTHSHLCTDLAPVVTVRRSDWLTTAKSAQVCEYSALRRLVSLGCCRMCCVLCSRWVHTSEKRWKGYALCVSPDWNSLLGAAVADVELRTHQSAAIMCSSMRSCTGIGV